MMGVTPEQAAAGLTEAGADVIGANCGQGIAGYVPICRRLSAATDLPLWIKPNAGLPELVDGRTVYRTTPEEFAVQIPSRSSRPAPASWAAAAAPRRISSAPSPARFSGLRQGQMTG